MTIMLRRIHNVWGSLWKTGQSMWTTARVRPPSTTAPVEVHT
jgi:hypothetical protein